MVFVQIAPHQPETGSRRVNVRILEPGQQQPPVERYDLRVRLDPLR